MMFAYVTGNIAKSAMPKHFPLHFGQHFEYLPAATLMLCVPSTHTHTLPYTHTVGGKKGNAQLPYMRTYISRYRQRRLTNGIVCQVCVIFTLCRELIKI